MSFTIEQAKEIRKFMNAYNRAEVALMKKRDELFPADTKVRCKMTGTLATVKQGSLYADQIFTDMGHMGFTYLEKLND